MVNYKLNEQPRINLRGLMKYPVVRQWARMAQLGPQWF